jgi:hypothetical protein
MEFVSTCYSIQTIEELCKILVAKKHARLLHDSSKYLKTPDGRIDHPGNKFNVKQYEVEAHNHYEANYQVFVGKSFEAIDVSVRFWYDKRIDKAGVKISRAGLNLILKSMTVVGLLRQLNLKVTNNGTDEVNLDLVKDVLTQAIKLKSAVDSKIEIVTE